MRCIGCQPARARTESDSSSAERKSCEMKGLYGYVKLASCGCGDPAHGPPPPFPRVGEDGLAQASHAGASTSPMEFATRRVSSIMSLAMQVYGRNPSKIIWSA